MAAAFLPRAAGGGVRVPGRACNARLTQRAHEVLMTERGWVRARERGELVLVSERRNSIAGVAAETAHTGYCQGRGI